MGTVSHWGDHRGRQGPFESLELPPLLLLATPPCLPIPGEVPGLAPPYASRRVAHGVRAVLTACPVASPWLPPTLAGVLLTHVLPLHRHCPRHHGSTAGPARGQKCGPVSAKPGALQRREHRCVVDRARRGSAHAAALLAAAAQGEWGGGAVGGVCGRSLWDGHPAEHRGPAGTGPDGGRPSRYGGNAGCASSRWPRWTTTVSR